jgi:hypothetical protein
MPGDSGAAALLGDVTLGHNVELVITAGVID